MIYLSIYLVIGVIVVGAVYILKGDRDGGPWLDEYFFDLPPGYEMFEAILNKTFCGFLLTLALSVMIALWPWALWNQWRAYLKEKVRAIELEKRKFRILHDELVAKTSVKKVEEAEKIFDPLGAVPDLPFGHLNGAWRKFISNMKPGDELWFFSTSRLYTRGDSPVSGYVLIRNGHIGPYFRKA